MKRNIVTADGTRLSVQLFGEDTKPRLLLSNSLGAAVAMWRPQIEALSADFQIACYDTRGHGESDAPDGEYSIDQLGQDVLAVADGLGWDTFNFAGVSLGGMTGFWLAINAPDRVSKVVAANGGPMAGGPEVWIERIDAVMSKGLAALSDTVSTRWFTPDFVAEFPDVVDELRVAFEATPAQGYAGCCAALRDLDLRSGIAGITVPMLVIGGEHDLTPPPSVLKMAADRVPGCQFRVLPAAHLSNVEASSAFNQALIEFILA